MSTEPTTEMMNEVIARFMGYKMYDKRYPRNHGIGAPEAEPEKCMIIQRAKYHTSWDWLMSVVEKIESIENSRFGVCIDCTFVIITDYGENEEELIQTDIYPDNEDTKISITHDAVYQFITWYKQQKQTNADGTPT